MDGDTTFGAWLKSRRRQLDLTQKSLAHLVGCSVGTIRKMEADERRPSRQLAGLLAECLEIPPDQQETFITFAREEPYTSAVSFSTLTPPDLQTPVPSIPQQLTYQATAGTLRGYQLLERIGEGRFGVVYRAVQLGVRREVAVKVIQPAYANQAEFIRRFEMEAQIVARLEHPHIVPLYDYWREASGAYLVMRWMRGGSLKDSLSNGSWTLEDSAQLINQVAGGLFVAHRQGVVHRDIKPANILLDEGGAAYLSDFGIAKDLAGEGQITQTGTLLTSPSYSTPEQALEQPISPQTDLYSLGIVIYELLTGQQPFTGSSLAAVIQKHISKPLPAVQDLRPEVPVVVDQVIQKATAKNPDDRYVDALTLAEAFEAAIVGQFVLERDRASIEVISLKEEITNPYRGLRSFQEADAGVFFGRQTLTEQLAAHLQESQFLAVVGPSGSGKSSVVKAGLIPALRAGTIAGSENWFVAQMIPGGHPLEELEAALLRVAVNPPTSLLDQLSRDERGLLRAVKRVLPGGEDAQLLLVVDQFEELFTLVADEKERAHFLDSLVVAVSEPRSPIRVVITLRADFYDQPLLHSAFGQLMRQHTEVVLPLTTDELREAIEEPSRRVSVALEQGLAGEIIADVNQQPGGLPLLQYAVTELFERRQECLLTRATYREIGGVLGALGRRAEELYAGLNDEKQAAARQLFLRLVTLGEGVEDTRRRVQIAELASIQMDDDWDAALLYEVMDDFGEYRLLTFDHDPITRGPTVEVAHEALLREWPRLRSWLAESRVDVRQQRVLTNFAAEWVGANRDPGMLLRGTRLSQFDEWSDLTSVNLTAQEDEYLQASLEARQEREAIEAERQAHEARLEQRSRRFLQALLGVFALATIIAVVLSILTFNAQMTAQAEAEQRATAQAMAEDEADARALAEVQALEERDSALEAYSLSLAGHALNALEANDTASALVLALAASGIENPPEEVQRVLRNVVYEPGPREQLIVAETFPGVEGRIYSLAASPTEDRILIGFEDGVISLFDLETRTEVYRLSGHADKVYDLAFNPDGRTAISGGGDHQVICWDLETGTEMYRLDGHHGWVRSVSISPDGRSAVTGGFAGDSIVSNAEPGELILWDLARGELVLRFGEISGGQPSGVVDAIFTPDGQSVLASYGIWTDVPIDFTQILWDIESGEPVYESAGYIYDNYSLAITPDGGQAISGGSDNNVHIWDLSSGEELGTLAGHGGLVSSVSVSPDGRRAFTGDWNGGLVLWDLASNIQLMHVNIHDIAVPWNTEDFPPVNTVFLSDGDSGLSSAGDGTLVIWDLVNAGQIRRIDGHSSEVPVVAFTPDGKYVLSGGGRLTFIGGPADDNTMKMWEVETGRLVHVFEGHTDSILVIAVSPDGSKALTGGGLDGTVKYWNLDSGELIRSVDAHQTGVFSLAFSPDGKQALSGGMGLDDVILWNLETGEMIQQIPIKNGNSTELIFHPNKDSAYNAGLELLMIDLVSGEISYQYQTENCCTGFAMHPDWKSIFTVDGGNRITQWDLETDQLIREFGDHDGSRSRLEISPDGNLLLSSDSTGQLYLWDPNTGNEIRRFRTDTSIYLFDIDISPDAHSAITPAEGGSAILWDLTLPSELDEVLDWISTHRYVRDLTCEERARYSIEPLCETEAQ